MDELVLPLRRRTLLHIAGWLPLAGAAALAGCASTGPGRLPGPDAAPDNPPLPSPMTDAQALEAALQAMALVGTPYRWGGNTPQSGFDCSGLVGYVYRRAAGLSPPRTVEAISGWGQALAPEYLRSGDLVIFGSSRAATHAGIHVGNARFVHAPSTGGTVRLDSVHQRYWSRRLLMYRRPLLEAAGA